MNLRNVENYNIGLDIGTGSVGWAVTDESGELTRFKGKPTWGSRVFPSAETAQDTRMNRGQRRRYDRRRQRLDLLQGFFAEEMDKVDPEFFVRLNQARLLKADRAEGHEDYRWPLFNDTDFTESDYYKKFPTIYHLRAWLTQTEDKADIRLIYLAFHNIVKHRGNFLHQDNPSLSATNASMRNSIDRLCEALEVWFEEEGIDGWSKPEPREIEQLFLDEQSYRKDRVKSVSALFGFPADQKRAGLALANALFGYKAEMAHIFGIEPSESNFYLSDDEKVDGFRAVCPDEGLELFEAMQAAYSAYVLMGILNGSDGETLSFCKVREYEKYGSDLATLKELAKEYCSKSEYDEFFRGPKYKDYDGYNPDKAKGYTRYNLKHSPAERDTFEKAVKKLLKSAEGKDPRYEQIMADIDAGTFLKRLKTRDNGVIPYQLHLEEMKLTIDRQGAFYPFLVEEADKITSLVTFRIPYYVGPLTTKNAAKNPLTNENRFAWSVRLSGKENEKIYPWNWDEIIDRDESAKRFMDRMVGTCSYLRGEQVLPRCSLVYEMFCVLNELNGAKWSQYADDPHRFDASDRELIIEDLFKKRKSVSYRAVANWMKNHSRFGEITVRGGQGETGFESKLSSYNDFCKLLDKDELSDSDMAMAEELILWNTLFEDRGILKRKVQQSYGDRLSAKQINQFCKKRYTGWGRLSKKLLLELQMKTDNGLKSVMDLLLEGEQNSGSRIGNALTFMEIMHDDRLGLQDLIDEANKQYADSNGLSIDDLQGSPALRRSVNQTMRVVDEIVRINGKAPANIYVEVTRSDDDRRKGTRTRRRYEAIKSALEAFKSDDPGLWNELRRLNPNDLDDRLSLYFIQRGKSMYSGKSLDINRLSEYHIDHIIPQSYIKDDSLENKVLVLQSENEAKDSALLIDSSIRRRMKSYWRELHEAKLIGDKKYNNLLRTTITDRQLKGFIARQLVETSQIVKFVQQMLTEKYPETKVVPIKAALTSQLRDERGFVKCREINDYHHAHDAYFAAQMGRFIQLRHGYCIDEPIKMARIIRNYIAKESKAYKYNPHAMGKAGFFVGSFLKSGFDKETGEVFFDDRWDAEFETERIRRCLNYKDCFISRMPEETTGAFWDETIYSPKEQKKSLSLPLKKGLDPNVYGSFSREQYAYFFMYSAYDKKNRVVAQFEPVPVSVASAMRHDDSALESFARCLAAQSGLTFKKILRSKIYKYQLIELDGNMLYITGKKEVRNARQLAFSQSETRQIKELCEGDTLSNDELSLLLETISVSMKKYAPKLYSALNIEKLLTNAENVSNEEKGDIVLRLVSISAAKTNMIDTSSIGGSRCSGQLHPSFGKIATKDKGVTIVDRSVTGMYEKRYQIEL